MLSIRSCNKRLFQSDDDVCYKRYQTPINSPVNSPVPFKRRLIEPPPLIRHIDSKGFFYTKLKLLFNPFLFNIYEEECRNYLIGMVKELGLSKINHFCRAWNILSVHPSLEKQPYGLFLEELGIVWRFSDMDLSECINDEDDFFSAKYFLPKLQRHDLEFVLNKIQD